MAEKTNHEEILELLANKKITLDEAMQMLSGTGKAETAAEEAIPAEDLKAEEAETVYIPDIEPLKAAEASAPVPARTTGNGNQKPNWLQIRVRDLDSGRNRVTVNLPLMMVKFGLNIARHFGAESDDIDLNQLAAQLNDAERGVLVDVQDEDSNEHVQISLA
jgi:hypothetical protein